MSMKVLIVDDHESNRLMVRFLLESEGHSCIEAENGKGAVEQFDEHRPDFVLTGGVSCEVGIFEAVVSGILSALSNAA